MATSNCTVTSVHCQQERAAGMVLQLVKAAEWFDLSKVKSVGPPKVLGTLQCVQEAEAEEIVLQRAHSLLFGHFI